MCLRKRFGILGSRLGPIILIIGVILVIVVVITLVYIAMRGDKEPQPKPKPCELTVYLFTDRDHYVLGRTVLIVAEVKNGSTPLIGALVDVNLTGPGSLQEGPYEMFDDGTHGDEISEDARYTNTYTLQKSDLPGVWRIDVLATKNGCKGTGSSGIQAHPHPSLPQVEVAEVEAWDETWGEPSDGVIDAGDYGTVRISLRNAGNDTARDVRGTLTTTDALVNVTDDYSIWGSIAKNQAEWPIDKGFKIKVDHRNDHTSTRLLLTIQFANASNQRQGAVYELVVPINRGLWTDLRSDKATYGDGETVHLSSTVRDSIHPVCNASVSFILTRPDSTVEGPYTMFDDGTHGDTEPGDGEYTCLVMLDQSCPEGSYTAMVRVEKGHLTTDDTWTFYKYTEEAEGYWRVNLTGGMTYRDGRCVYEKNATYGMEIDVMDHWAIYSNWLRHYLPDPGKGFLFINLTVLGHGYPNHTVHQDWALKHREGRSGGPCWLVANLSVYDDQIFDLWCPQVSLGLTAQEPRSYLLVFEADPAWMPVQLVVEDKTAKQVLVEVGIEESALQYPELEHIRDIGHLEGERVARQVGPYTVGTDREGVIVLVYVEEEGTKVTKVSMARKVGEDWVSGHVCRSAKNVTSLAFLEDRGGRYLVVYSTVENLERSPSWSVDNTSLWLTISGDRGRSWSRPQIVYSKVVGGEGYGGLRNPALAQDSCGGLYLAWTYQGRRWYSMKIIISPDGGQSWSSEPVHFGWNRLMSMYSDTDGLHLVYIAANWFGRGHLKKSVSTDCGKTWQEPVLLLPYDLYFARLYRETRPCMESTFSSSVLWLFWLRGWDNRHVLEYSLDQGRTWTTMATLSQIKERSYTLAWEQLCHGPPDLLGSCLYLFWKETTDTAQSVFYAPLQPVAR